MKLKQTLGEGLSLTERHSPKIQLSPLSKVIGKFGSEAKKQYGEGISKAILSKARFGKAFSL